MNTHTAATAPSAPFVVLIGYGPAETVRVRVYKTVTATQHDLIDQTDFDYEGHVEAIAEHLTGLGIRRDLSTRGNLGTASRYAAYLA